MKTYAITTEQRIKDELSITVTDLDTMIKRYIYGATDFITRYCNAGSFKQTTYTDELYNGSEYGADKKDSILILKNAPVQSITSIKYNSGTQNSPTWNTLSADSYTVDKEKGIIYFDSTLNRGVQNIAITYQAGYLLDFANEFDETKHTVPFELTELCERLVIKRMKKRDSEGKTTETFNGSTITWGNLLDDEDKTILANYNRCFVV